MIFFLSWRHFHFNRDLWKTSENFQIPGNSEMVKFLMQVLREVLLGISSPELFHMDSTYSADLVVTLALQRAVLPLHGSNTKERSRMSNPRTCGSILREGWSETWGRQTSRLLSGLPTDCINHSQLVSCICHKRRQRRGSGKNQLCYTHGSTGAHHAGPHGKVLPGASEGRRQEGREALAQSLYWSFLGKSKAEQGQQFGTGYLE